MEGEIDDKPDPKSERPVVTSEEMVETATTRILVVGMIHDRRLGDSSVFPGRNQTVNY